MHVMFHSVHPLPHHQVYATLRYDQEDSNWLAVKRIVSTHDKRRNRMKQISEVICILDVIHIPMWYTRLYLQKQHTSTHTYELHLTHLQLYHNELLA